LLFDTKSPAYGGTGKKFNWNKLTEYSGDMQAFLSGGIGPDDAEEIKNLRNRCLFSLDINSRFEHEPGMKNIQLLEKFINEIRNK
jgi:phosphoribosylanthranilate isomerase